MQRPNAYLAVSAVIVGMTLLQAGNGILITLLPLRMTAAGLAAIDVGIVATGYSLGFLIGCLLAPPLVRMVGHIRAFAALAAIAAVATLSFTIKVDTFVWAASRCLMGYAMAGMMTAVESWISERTPSEMRGRVFSTYMIAIKLAMGGGPLLLSFGDIMGPGFFMLISALFSLSLLPIALTRGPSPALPPLKRLSVMELYRIAPAGVVGCTAIGLINGAVSSMTPVYGASLGLATAAVAGLMAAMQLGSLVIQYPLGWLSDRIDRRHVIIGVGVAMMLIAAGLGFAHEAPRAYLNLMFALWGGASLSAYAVCLAHTADRARPDQMVGMSSSLLLAWAIGSAIGPALASVAMDHVGPGGLFHYAAAVAFVFVAFVLYRTTRRAAQPPGEREPFVTLPPPPGPLSSTLDPRLSEEAVRSAMDDLAAKDGETPDDDEDAAMPEDPTPPARADGDTAAGQRPDQRE